MAAVKTSDAQRELNIALGNESVSLSKLDNHEFIDFLKKDVFKHIRLKQLRGFSSLRDILENRTGDEPITYGESLEYESDNDIFTLETQAMAVGRGYISGNHTFRRHESDEETTDYQVANVWGKSAYVYSGNDSQLILFRPKKETWNSERLALVTKYFAKVPHENRYLITKIVTTALPISERLFEVLGERAHGVMSDFIWDLRSLFSRTRDELNSQAKRMQELHDVFEILGRRIME